jgi:hypothetical protein
MGSFEGHALPGLFFFVFGISYTFAAYMRFFRAHFGRTEYSNKSALTLGRFPAEAALKLAASLVGIAGEAATGYPKNGAPFYKENEQGGILVDYMVFLTRRTWSRNYKSPSPSPPARFRIYNFTILQILQFYKKKI